MFYLLHILNVWVYTSIKDLNKEGETHMTKYTFVYTTNSKLHPQIMSFNAFSDKEALTTLRSAMQSESKVTSIKMTKEEM